MTRAKKGSEQLSKLSCYCLTNFLASFFLKLNLGPCIVMRKVTLTGAWAMQSQSHLSWLTVQITFALDK
jgi:hypothetical protein